MHSVLPVCFAVAFALQNSPKHLNTVRKMQEALVSAEPLRVGFVGTGKISSAVARKYCRLYTHEPTENRALQIIVSPRNALCAASLRDAFPDMVCIAESNEAVVRGSSVVFIGLLPSTAAEVLPTLPFREDQLLVSMMAAVDYSVLCASIHCHASRIVRSVPLTADNAPTLMYPASDAHARILRMIGPVVQCESEPEMRALVTVTGTIAAFHRVQDCAFEHLRRNGVAPSAAASYVGSFYSALANFSVHAITSNADRSADEQSPFAALAEEATTPGGLNEQYAAEVQRDGAFDALEKGLSNLLARLNR